MYFRSSRGGTKASGGEPFSRYYDYKSGSSRTYSAHKSQSTTTTSNHTASRPRQPQAGSGYESSDLSFQLDSLSLRGGHGGQASGQSETECHIGYLEVAEDKREDTFSDRRGAYCDYEGRSDGGTGGAEGGYDHDDHYDAGYANYNGGDDDDYDY